MNKPSKLPIAFVIILIRAKLSFVQAKFYTVSSKMLDQKYNNATQTLLPENSNNRNIFFSKSCIPFADDFETSSAKNLSILCKERSKLRLDEQSFLLTFLIQLKICQLVSGKPWLDKECANPLHDITDYHKASYDKMCNPAKYASFCQLTELKQDHQPSTIIRRWLKQRNIAIQDSSDKILNETFHTGNTTNILPRLGKMICQSIESYFEVLSENLLQEDFDNVTLNSLNVFYNFHYTEWFHKDIAFCEDVGCGVSRKNYKNFSITFHDCASEFCQIAIIVAMVVDGVIALLVVVSNILVVIVFFRTSIMKNNPGYFKLNLAIADFGIGLIIIPSVIYNRYHQTYSPLPYRCDGKFVGLIDYFSQGYLTTISFFGLLLFFVSVFTLLVASIDRYFAVSRPFKYNKGKYFTKKRTIVTLLLIWLLGAALSMTSIFGNSSYELFGNDLILAWNQMYVAFLGLTIPLILAWILNIAIFFSVRAQNQKKNENKKKRSQNANSQSNRTSASSISVIKLNCTNDWATESQVHCFSCKNTYKTPDK